MDDQKQLSITKDKLDELLRSLSDYVNRSLLSTSTDKDVHLAIQLLQSIVSINIINDRYSIDRITETTCELMCVIKKHNRHLHIFNLICQIMTQFHFVNRALLLLDNVIQPTFDSIIIQLIVNVTRFDRQCWRRLSIDYVSQLNLSLINRIISIDDQLIIRNAITIIISSVFISSNHLLQLRSIISKHTIQQLNVSMLKLSTKSGFAADTKQLLQCIDTRLSPTFLIQQHATITIQSYYRSYRIRRQHQRMIRGIIKLQRIYRQRRNRKLIALSNAIAQQELNINRSLAAIRLSRDYQQRKLVTITNLHPKLINRFLANERDAYATTIQRAYRRHLRRRIIKMHTNQHVITISRKYVNIWRYKMRLIAFRRQWITLNDERRLELQTQINAQLPSVGGYEHEQMVAIHHRVQPLLTEYIKRRKMHRDADEFMQRDQLIANITDDINWLIAAPPSLAQLDRDYRPIPLTYETKSTTIRAIKYHNEVMKVTDPSIIVHMPLFDLYRL